MADQDLDLIVQKWMKGDHHAFESLYDTFADSVYRYIFFKVGDFDAEDLTELVFLKVWEARSSYNPDKSAFKTWLFTIARNIVIDFYRSNKETLPLNEAIDIENTDLEGPKQFAHKNIEEQGMKEALSNLEENYREVITLRYIEDLSYSEIADLLEKTESAIRVLHFRGLKKLKQVLKEGKYSVSL